MGVRFSFDIGTNSIGSAVWKTGPDPNGRFGADAPRELLWAGVRIFKDGRNPRDGESLAKMRRVPKQARKRRDRFVLRRADLTEALIEAGLMPSNDAARRSLESLDPYRLRAQSLDHALDLHELGRAIFHLHQRRGFKSNRRTDKGDKDKGKIADASKRLEELLKERNCRTFGEFLWMRHRGSSHDPARPRDPGRQPTRIRLEGQGAKALYAMTARQRIRTAWDRRVEVFINRRLAAVRGGPPATNKSQQKSRGRRPTPRGTMKGVQVAVRLSAEEVAKLDAWIAEQKQRFGAEFSRAAAIRAKLIQFDAICGGYRRVGRACQPAPAGEAKE
jgi:CRISPR/Cas system Type II protein with McrA/HNH and RuvC-like nuclease domain